MSQSVRAYSIFLASPGDVSAERAAVVRAAEAVNHIVGKPLGLRLDVARWEQVQPTFGRAQEAINPLVETCNLFIGILWRRFGSHTGEYESGFLEEFEGALRRQGESTPPAVGLYFRDVPPDQLSDPGRELKRVLKFQRRIQSNHLALYRSYESIAQFELAVHQFLTNFLMDRKTKNSEPPQGSGESSAGAAPHIENSGPNVAQEAALTPGDAARDQVGRMLDAWSDLAHGRQEGPSGRVLDFDRIVSFGMAVSREDLSIPVHTANRLYRRQEELHLLAGEASMWLRTMCEDRSRVRSDWGAVVPGWRLLGISDSQDELADIALTLNGAAANGAIDLLTAMRLRPRRLWAQQRPEGGAGAQPELARLLTGEATSESTLEYVFRLASTADTPLLEAIVSSVGEHDQAPAIRAVFDAISGQYESTVDWFLSRPYAAGTWALEATGLALSGLSPERLVAIISQQTAPLGPRLSAFATLLSKAGSAEIDVELGVRAVKAVLNSRETRLKSLLSPGRMRGDLSQWLARAWDSIPKDNRWELADQVRAALNTSDELAKAASTSFSGMDAWKAWSRFGDVRQAGQAREVLRSQGASFSVAVVGEGASEDLRRFVREEGRRAALRVLRLIPAEDREGGDLALVRNEVDAATWQTSDEALLALMAFGEPEDAPRLLSASDKSVRADLSREAVGAACRLGGEPLIREVLAKNVGFRAEEAARVAVESDWMTTEELHQLLLHKTPEVRRCALFSLEKRLDRAGLVALLETYPSSGTSYYYDVMCRLDWLLYADPEA